MRNRFTSVFATLLTSCFIIAASFNQAQAQSYCTPGGSGSSYGVNTVKTTNGLINFLNSATGYTSGGYANYTTTDSVSAMQGATFKLQTTAINYDCYWSVWIDWNDDGDFSDPGELVYQTALSSSGITQDITVPYSATAGSTRMRIIASSSSISGPCVTSGSLEAEDYGVFIVAAPACTGTPNAGTIMGPSTLHLCASTPFTLTDTGATGAANMTYQWQKRNPSGTGTWTDIAGANSFTLSFPSGITTSTDYRFYVVCNNSNQSDTSNVIVVSMNAATDCYCEIDFSNLYYYYVGYAYISSVKTTGGTININNASSYTPVGYEDFRNTDTLGLMAGNQIIVTPSLSSTSTFPPDAGFMAWIDWNHDGDFDDPGENVVSVAQQSLTNSFAGTFTVPITAIPGHTTMRVMSGVYIDNFDPCGVDIVNEYYSWGEAEDYTVIVDSLPDCSSATYPTTVSASIDHDTLCVSGDVTLNLDTVLYFSGITYQWQKSSTGTGSWTDIGTGQISPLLTVTGVSANTWYRCQVKCHGTTMKTSSVVKTHVSNPSMASAPTSGTRCGPGTVALSASPATGNSVNWYDQPTGGSPLVLNSSTYTTYYIPQTTVFYAASAGGTVSNTGIVGPTGTVGTGVVQWTYQGNPLAMQDGSAKHQILVSAAEMNAQGFNKAGFINSIGLDVLTAGSLDTLDFTISIGQTSDADLTSGWHPVTEVYHNPYYEPVANSMNTYAFTQPFFWDGFSNIVIQFCTHSHQNAYPSSDWSVRGDANYVSGLPTFRLYYTDYSQYDQSICDTPAFYSYNYYSPNIQFDIHELCEGPREPDTAFVTPGPDFSIAYDSVVCNNSVNSLEVSSTLSNYAQGYTWTALDASMQLYNDAAGTTAYVSGTNKNKIYFKSSVAGLHRVAVHASNGPAQTDCAAADTADIWVQPGNISILGIPDTICGGSANPVSQLKLMPNSGYSSGPYIQWQESADNITYNNIPAAQSTSYTTVPLYTNHYYKAVISAVAGACETPDKLVVVANPVVSSTTDSSNCGPGTVTLLATTGGNSHPVWYDSDTGTTSIGTGSPFVTPFLTETDTFYVSASGGAASVPGSAILGAGATTNSGTYTGFYTYYGNQSIQYLITKDELNALGYTGGAMLSLGINVSSANYPNQVFKDFEISMKNSTMTTMNSGAFETGMQTVYGPHDINFNATGWKTFTFDQPFIWDGSSNVVIQWCWSNNLMLQNYNYPSIKMDLYTSNVEVYQYSYNAITASDICGHTNISSGYSYAYKYRPQFQIEYLGPCETAREMVIATINPKPVVDLGQDINICVDSGAAIVLNAGVQPNSPQFSWNNGSNSQVISTNQSGTYSVTVTNSYDCATSDTVDVVLRHNPKVTLPDDTSVCINTPTVLDAGPFGIQYFWNTGATTQAITVNTGGTYTVLVTNNDGCTVGDTIVVDMSGNQPHYDGIQITNDAGMTFTFHALNPQDVVGYDWDFGDGSPHKADSSPTHTYLQDGNYVVTLNVMSACGGYVDSTSAHILGIGQVNLGNDQLAIYPNPTKEKATIETKGVKMERIVIFNVLGQKIYEAPADSPYKHELDLKAVASGVYNISVYTDKGMVSRKLNVIK